jgi:hypothetical protein
MPYIMGLIKLSKQHNGYWYEAPLYLPVGSQVPGAFISGSRLGHQEVLLKIFKDRFITFTGTIIDQFGLRFNLGR